LLGVRTERVLDPFLCPSSLGETPRLPWQRSSLRVHRGSNKPHRGGQETGPHFSSKAALVNNEYGLSTQYRIIVILCWRTDSSFPLTKTNGTR
jgi:hypothetical protein